MPYGNKSGLGQYSRWPVVVAGESSTADATRLQPRLASRVAVSYS
jgi:hypothetical protein